MALPRSLPLDLADVCWTIKTGVERACAGICSSGCLELANEGDKMSNEGNVEEGVRNTEKGEQQCQVQMKGPEG